MQTTNKRSLNTISPGAADKRATFVVRIRWLIAMPVDNMASPENPRDRHTDSSAKAAGLKGRCDRLQVLSRGLTPAGSRQDLLHEPSTVRTPIRVKRCRLIGLNALQGTSQRILVLGRPMHCKRAKTDDSHSNHHCRDQAYSDSSLVLHKFARIRAMRVTVNDKEQKSHLRALVGVDGTPETSVEFSVA